MPSREAGTHLARTLRIQLRLNQTTQVAFAKEAGLPASTVTNLLTEDDFRPTDAVLRKLGGAWPDRRDNVALVQAYLKDEIIRTGFSLVDFTIEVPDHETVTDARIALLAETLRNESAHKGKKAVDDLLDVYRVINPRFAAQEEVLFRDSRSSGTSTQG